MNFIRINAETLNHGDAVFNDYVRYAICGKADREGHEAGKRRRGGVTAIPGALIACLDSGILDFAAVVSGVARATRCRTSTVEAFLRDVLGINADDGRFDEAAGVCIEGQLLASNTLIAA